MASSPSSSPFSDKCPQRTYMDHDIHSSFPKLNRYSVSFWKIIMHDYIEGNGLISFIEPMDEQLKCIKTDCTKCKEIDDQLRCSIISTIQDDLWKELSSSFLGNTSAELWNFILQNVQRLPAMTHVDHVSCDTGANKLGPPMLTIRVIYTVANQPAEGKNLAQSAEGKNLAHLELYKAIVGGDMNTVQEKLDEDKTIVSTIITGASETPLIVACLKKTNINLVKKLISLMSPPDLKMRNSFGRTAIFGAAAIGHVEAMEEMVKKNPDLPYICDMYNQLPVHYAACAGEKGSVDYLLQVTDIKKVDELKRLRLVHALISGGFYDLPDEMESPVEYYKSTNTNDTENSVKEVDKVPKIRKLQKKKVMHTQAGELLKFICSEIAKLDSNKSVRDLIGHSLEAAAAMGNAKVVEEILVTFPNALFLVNENKHNVFHIAIANRKADVFNIIYQIKTQSHLFLAQIDASYNTALHLAARLVEGTEDHASPNLRSSAPGAALQMQRELQWFKEVKKLSRRQDKEQRNIYGKTPSTIFTESHEKLAKEGEDWMKDRANSGIIVATLIATIVFTSAITVPGGTNSGSGLPIFSERVCFVVFAVADALALFMSASSMLMFLGILTARYTVEDFRESLPKRLIIALVTLFLSIIFMMVAFTSILYLVFGDEQGWVLALTSSLAAVPVLLFAFLQFNPLLDIISSTYGPGMFGKRGNCILI
ncbi:uncharacterized protein LOC143546815 [Bidens hawaiensis]|uniref:uncharacterized protein LOC143546815 n=1 Tax=Bidens hawaiensis TaxID=980011 RepID=UPI00404B11BE